VLFSPLGSSIILCCAVVLDFPSRHTFVTELGVCGGLQKHVLSGHFVHGMVGRFGSVDL
jgi:hypothetical protein